MAELALKYGCNPHQKSARILNPHGPLPFNVLNGAPGYINLLDALNSWQLVKELREALDTPAAASFKHLSPAGAAVAEPLNDDLKKAYFVQDMDLSPLAVAYARARGADRLSSYGDWAALSDTVDVATARLLRREVSDGVIAPGYRPEALEILKQKKGGAYPVLQIDPDYRPRDKERREVFGLTFEQQCNDLMAGPEVLKNVVTRRKEISAAKARDMLVATITLKFTQSNSICFALQGQAIGVGAGQQNRLACTDIAAGKAEAWFLRQHPAVLGLEFRKGARRPEKINAIELYLRGNMTSEEQSAWRVSFRKAPPPFGEAPRREWLRRLKGVTLGSDAYIPFRDNIDRAARTGVEYVIQTGGSVQDDAVIAAADEYGMVMVNTGIRLFHH